MAARQKRAHRVQIQPGYAPIYLGFEACLTTSSLKRKKDALFTITESSSCREEILYETRRELKDTCYTYERVPDSWRTEETRDRKLSIDDPRTKQPRRNYFLSIQDEEDYGCGGFCTRACCAGKLIHILDAIVAQVGLLLDPDWYQGNWWETGPEDINRTIRNSRRNRYDERHFRYYGTSNFFMRHPALLHSMLGLFRQAIDIYSQDLDGPLHNLLPRKDVERALSQSDPELALRNIQKIRPWIEVPAGRNASSYAFPAGYWNRLIQLHKAIYKHGYEKVFGGTMEEGWKLDDASFSGRVNGAWSYWGNRRVTEPGRRLARLGK